MARTIPQIRTRLYEKAVELCDPELALLAGETMRRTSGRKARAKQRPITREVCDWVRVYAAYNPDLHFRDIGRDFNIDGGRVSEIVNGFRDGQTYEEKHNL